MSIKNNIVKFPLAINWFIKMENSKRGNEQLRKVKKEDNR